ncbi:MAG: NAD-dependent epimerase/dehydratase family protein [Desulfovibrionaceae bacterium]|nr:NAD-dependent epimerase/dehydratase family protein [Desulfovibrionaceae bacterium]
MSHTRILIPGGAGFVGSSLAVALRQACPASDIICLDNLKRRGSEVILARLRQADVRFVHGDIRFAQDLEQVGPVDLMIECSAEPSAGAGYGGSPDYLLQTNLVGAVNCLEYLRRFGGDLIFLSSSRVYPITPLRALPLADAGRRLDIPADASGPGWSHVGVTTDFPMVGHRTLYGATKLTAELLIAEYAAMYGLRAVVNRCGVIAGPWQMGKVDQGFMVLWVARHYFRGTLGYIGFGGQGRQVRDVLHVDDLFDLVLCQMRSMDRFAGQTFNVGGGLAHSTSLLELTDLCRNVTGNTIDIGSFPDTSAYDVPYYVTDNTRITQASQWAPGRGVEQVVRDIHAWIVAHERELASILAQ